MRSVSYLEAVLNRRPSEKHSGGRIALTTVIDGWRVEAYVGKGGTAEVYRLVDAENGRHEAALKLLVDASSGRDVRFNREVELVKSLSLSSLPHYYGSGEWNGLPYYILEYLQPNLPPPRHEVIPFVAALARAVDDLHKAGYLHRDLKPANVLRRRTGEPVLIDLGLAKRISDASNPPGARNAQGKLSPSLVNGHPVAVGTNGFSAPEQLISGVASVRSDVFALGQIFKAYGGKKLGHAARHVIKTATMSDPDDRYPDAAAFEAAVRGIELRRRIAVTAGAVACCAAIAFCGVQIAESGGGALPDVGKNPQEIPKAPESAGLLEGLELPELPETPERPEKPGVAPVPGPQSAPDRPVEPPPDASLKRILEAAESGDADAQCEAAEAYYHGRGVATNRVEAVRRYRLAAEAGNVGAQATLGTCLLRGIGCDKDSSEAVVWFSRAVEQGNPGAMVSLALCLRKGDGIERSPEEAFSMALRAAKTGHAEGQAFVGECYRHGWGVEKDVDEARKWFRMAAGQGHPRAKAALDRLR